MDRKDFFSLLRQLGTNDKLIDKPGIIEPIYEKLKEKSANDVINTKALLILKSGAISFQDVDYFLTDNGEDAKIIYGDKEIGVNKFGIQVSLNSGDGSNFYSYMLRKNGIIECVSGNNGKHSRKYYLDNGDCLIERACGKRVNATVFGKADREGEEIDRARLDEATILAGFDANVRRIVRDYPSTIPYYKKLREIIIYNIHLQNDPMRKLQRSIERLKAENDLLRRKNRNLTKRLHAANTFIEGVRKNPASRFLLKREITDKELVDRMYSD